MAVTILFVGALLCTIGRLTQATTPVTIGCSGSSNYKWINLVRTHSIGSCSYEIRPYNAFVCQLRVDFSTDLELPTVPAVPAAPGSPACNPRSAITIGRFTICGRNERQHLYINFDSSHLSNFETIKADISSGIGNYRMTVTQIECPLGLRRSTAHLQGYGSWYNSWHYNGAGLNTNDALFDAYKVAPESCDQYHLSSKGIVESFNFNSGNGPYSPVDMLKVCFKTPPRAKTMRLTGLKFDLGANAVNPRNDVDIGCYDPMLQGSSTDFVSIPSSRILETGISAGKYCGIILQSKTVESNLYETAYFIFNAGVDSVVNSNRVYQFKYEIH